MPFDPLDLLSKAKEHNPGTVKAVWGVIALAAGAAIAGALVGNWWVTGGVLLGMVVIAFLVTVLFDAAPSGPIKTAKFAFACGVLVLLFLALGLLLASLFFCWPMPLGPQCRQEPIPPPFTERTFTIDVHVNSTGNVDVLFDWNGGGFVPVADPTLWGPVSAEAAGRPNVNQRLAGPGGETAGWRFTFFREVLPTVGVRYTIQQIKPARALRMRVVDPSGPAGSTIRVQEVGKPPLPEFALSTEDVKNGVWKDVPLRPTD